MAINPSVSYPDNTANPSVNYPYGSARDVSTPGDNTGTPWAENVLNDIWGFNQALLDRANVTPNGTPDNVSSSQYIEALDKIYGAYPTITEMVADDIEAGKVVAVTGYSSAGGRGAKSYLIQTPAQFGGSPDEVSDFTINNGNIAVLQFGGTTTDNFGLAGDGVTDNAARLTAMDNKNIQVNVTQGVYSIQSNIEFNNIVAFEQGARFKSENGALIRFKKGYLAGGYHVFDLSGIIKEEYTSAASQTVFNLANAYVPGSGNLFVYYNDMLMDVTTGYTETSSLSITMTFPVPAGVKIRFQIGGYQFGQNRNDFADVPTIVCYPEHFGALGVDLSADDTDAVQACFDSQVYFKFLQNYFVSQVTLEKSERRGDFRNYKLVGNAVSSTSSVLELKCGFSKLHNIRVSCQFKTNYETGIHWYTNQLPGLINGVFGFFPGQNKIFGMQIDSALIGLTVGALPSQSAAAMPPQTSTDQVSPTAINAPISESDISGFSTQDCLVPLRIRQANGKITMDGVLSPSFGAFSTSSRTAAFEIAGVDGGELGHRGGALENVVDTSNNGELIYMENGNYYAAAGVVTETVTTSYLEGAATVRMSQCLNTAINSNSVPFFAVKHDSDARIIIDNQRLDYPANRFGLGTNPLIKTVTDRATLSFAPSDKFVAKFSDCDFRDVPFWGVNNPVTGGRAEYSNVLFDSIPSAGAARDELYRITGTENLMAGVVDIPATTVSAYPQTVSGSSGGWNFTITGASNPWGSDNSSLPTPELLPISNAIRLTTIAAQSAFAVSDKINVAPSKAHIFDCWSKTDGGGATIIFRARYFKFDGTASSITAEDNFIIGASSIIGTTYRPISGLFKTPADCTQVEIMIYVENAAELFFVNPSLIA